MSFKDYRNFARKNDEVKEPEVVEITEQNNNSQNEIVNDEVVNVEPIQNENIEQEVEKEVEKELDKFTKGTVKAGKLNVRKEANKEADVLTIISKGTGVEINLTKSTEDFYCVKVLVNAELTTGYVMKEFVNVK